MNVLLELPACIQFSRKELIISMESAIRAFLAVMNGESRETVEGLLQDSQTHLENSATEIQLVNKCAPFCLSKAAGKSPLAASSIRMGAGTFKTGAEIPFETAGLFRVEKHF